MNAFNTKNFKIIKIKGYYRLKFTGKTLPTIQRSIEKWGGLNTPDKLDYFYKFVLRHKKMCYISTKGGKSVRNVKVFCDNDEIKPFWETYDAKTVKQAKSDLSSYKKFMKTNKYANLTDDQKVDGNRYVFEMTCNFEEFYKCIQLIIDKCKKIKIDTIIMPFLIFFECGGMHHNNIIIKGKKAWRVEHVYGQLPQINDYLEKQFNKVGIKFQGNLYHIGNQSITTDTTLAQFWSAYFAFYYSLNKKIGFDDMFYTPGKDPYEEMTYQIRLFLAYSIELLKKIKASV